MVGRAHIVKRLSIASLFLWRRFDRILLLHFATIAIFVAVSALGRLPRRRRQLRGLLQRLRSPWGPVMVGRIHTAMERASARIDLCSGA